MAFIHNDQPLLRYITLPSSSIPPTLPPRPNPPLSSTSPPLPPRSLVIDEEVIPPLLSSPIARTSLVEGLSDTKLNVHLRRFNKQVRHLRIVTPIQESQLDLESKESFHPDVLRSNIERFHASVISSLISLSKEIVRLRNWSNPIRTSSWLSVYFIAWNIEIAGALFVTVLAGLIAFPSFRVLLFPPDQPLPIATTLEVPPVSPTTENLRELEAETFAEDLAAVSSFKTEETTVEEILQASKEREIIEEEQVNGGSNNKHKDHGKLAKIGLPIQRITGETADAWERWENVLNPTSTISTSFRIKAAACLIPVILIFLVCPLSILVRSFTFLLGVAFFGDPLFQFISRGLDAYAGPGWKKKLEISHSILKGAPTNAQFTISLLRLSELSGKPLPPPPRLATPISTPTLSPSLPRNDSQTSLIDYPEITSSPSTSSSISTSAVGSSSARKVSGSGPENKTARSRFAAFVRGATKVGEEGSAFLAGHKTVPWEAVSRIAVDKVKAVTGSSIAEHFMTVIPRPTNMDDQSSSSIFYAHLSGRPGHLLLLPPTSIERESSSSWFLEFVPVGTASTPKSTSATSSLLRPRSASVVSTTIPPSPIIQVSTRIKIRISNITELRKTAGIGWKGRLAAGLLLGVGSEGDGLEVKWKDGGANSFSGVVNVEEVKKFSAIVRRDELFNRLASLDTNLNWELA